MPHIGALTPAFLKFKTGGFKWNAKNSVQFCILLSKAGTNQFIVSHNNIQKPLKQAKSARFSIFRGLTNYLSFYNTTISVLLGSPSPALFTAMMRYSSSLPFGCSTNVASVITAVATSSHAPAGRSLRITL